MCDGACAYPLDRCEPSASHDDVSVALGDDGKCILHASTGAVYWHVPEGRDVERRASLLYHLLERPAAHIAVKLRGQPCRSCVSLIIKVWNGFRVARVCNGDVTTPRHHYKDPRSTQPQQTPDLLLSRPLDHL
jgi:hypothetical protein